MPVAEDATVEAEAETAAGAGVVAAAGGGKFSETRLQRKSRTISTGRSADKSAERLILPVSFHFTRTLICFLLPM